jgi:autotransporter-associated beta strand protein
LASSAASGRVETNYGDTGVTNYGVVHHADIVISDYLDGNPSNNAGTYLADYYIDGKCVGSLWDIWDLADVQNNFLGFVAWQVPGSSFAYDNFKVYGNDVLLDTTNQWQGVSGANWTDPLSWTASVPNGQGQNALIFDAYSTLNSVNLDADVVVGNLSLKNEVTTISSTTGNKLTFQANAGDNSKLQVLQVHSLQTISVPIELKNDLDITVIPGTRLDLTSSLTAPDGPVNVSITPDSCGYPGSADPLSGNVVISGSVAPGGAFNLFGGVVNVVSGGSLTASSVYLGDRKSWNLLQVDAGATLTTESVSGDATLAIYGGTVATPTAGKPALDIRALSLGGGTNYTFEDGETQTIAEVLGNGDMSSTLTFDGGTMKIRPDRYSPYGGTTFGCIGYTGIALANLYVTDKGANFDLSGSGVVVNQPFVDAPGLTGNAGPVRATNGVQFSMTASPTFTGGFIFDNSGTTYAGSDPAWFGTGTVQAKNGAGVTYEPDVVGSHVAGIATNFFLSGPSTNPYYATLMVDWRGSVEFTGTIDVTDLTTYPAGDQRNFAEISAHSHAVAPTCYIDIAGPITGTGGVQFGKAVEAGATANGLVYLSGSQSNTFAGAAVQTMGVLVLQKTDGAVAIPHDLVLAPAAFSTGVMLGADNQTSPTDTVVRLMNSRTDWWVNFALNGHATTVRGITSNPNGLNGIDNLTIAPNGNGFADFMVTPTTQGTLTINTQAGDDFTYASYIADAIHLWSGLDPATIGKVALVKDGPGIQRLTPGNVWTAGLYAYTGGTTVKAGTLDISTVTSFTPNSPVAVEGGELAVGDLHNQTWSSVALKTGMITGAATVSSLTDFDMQAGLATVGLAGGAGLVKSTTGTVTLAGPLSYTGNTDVQAGTLEIDGVATLTTVTGADVGTVKVCDGASLTAASIQVGTLVIGGTPTYTAPPASAAVPEPSAIVLLVLAGLAVGWFKFRKQ